MSWNYEPLINCHIKYKYQYTETHLGNVKSLFNSKIPATITQARPIDRATLLLIYRSSVKPLNWCLIFQHNLTSLFWELRNIQSKFFEYKYVMCVKYAVRILVSLLNIPLIIMDNNLDYKSSYIGSEIGSVSLNTSLWIVWSLSQASIQTIKYGIYSKAFYLAFVTFYYLFIKSINEFQYSCMSILILSPHIIIKLLRSSMIIYS